MDVKRILELAGVTPPQILHVPGPVLSVVADFAPRFPTYAALVAPGKAMTVEDHQATGSSWLIENAVGVQGDDMGLGKSKMLIDAVRHIWKRGTCSRVLIVAKAGNIETWAEEIAKFDPDARVFVAAGTTGKREKKYALFLTFEHESLAYLIVSYEVLRSDIERIVAQRFDWVVCDEAHKLKSNPLNDDQSQIAQVIHRIKAPRMHAMTGTILVNAPEDAWNILTWLGIETRSWKLFEDETCRTIKYNISAWTERKKIIGYRAAGLEKLRSLLLPNLIRRDKREVTTLPATVRENVYVTLNPEEQKYYTEARKELNLAVDEDLTKIPNDNVLKLRLKQITSSIEPFVGKPYKSTKLAAALDLIEDAIASGQKVIVFSQFLAVVAALRRELGAHKLAVVTGGSEDRQADVHRFQEDPACKVFIGSTSACREGLTLTAASVIVFIDLEWSPTYVEQAIGRADRIGQTRSVTVYTLIARQRGGQPTIDTGIQANLASKSQSMARVLG
jgi:SNF2 family DNA or RNA helicase